MRKLELKQRNRWKNCWLIRDQEEIKFQTSIETIQNLIATASATTTEHLVGAVKDAQKQLDVRMCACEKEYLACGTKLFWIDILLYENKTSLGTLMIFLFFKPY